MSQAAFCRQLGIKKSAFDYYRNKGNSDQKGAPRKLVPVEVAVDATKVREHSADYQVALPSGATLSIPQNHDKATLLPLLKLLGVCA